ncbi:hypothetical protein GGX14DRAFT_397696 [Mycena pura]|uniref:HNH nuclease domain-containing protein n=1 Tax=Mycena pura TaxID=153505 RepID=A0AAD6VFF7_9AGAR|nr:hypothetical protein GGX14DRAFT_397696 [Mycena pura]
MAPLWGANRDPLCILPLTNTKYLNEDQRNVSVWMSTAPPLTRSRDSKPIGGRNTLRLLADHRLLKIDDPRGRGLPHPNTYHNLLELRADPSRPVPQGHYILVAVERYFEGRETMTRLVPCSVGQQEPAIGQRSVTRTATAGSATFARDDDLRADVRVRDMRCRITGDTAPQRDRGANFMGLEVAHVFPLGEVEQFSMAFDSNSASHRAGLFDALDLSDQPRKEEIDIPENAVVLRRDVHSHFDGYEITLESRIVKGQTVQVVRLFEKDAAPGIARDGMWKLLERAPGNVDIADVNDVLLAHHYLTGVLWHVAGNGRPSLRNAPGMRNVPHGHADL